MNAASAHSKPRILIVEDDLDTCKNMRDILEWDDYFVEIATNGAEALACSNSGNITVVILDRSLPDQNTEELIPKFRKSAPDAAIIIVTGYADLDGALAALRLGAADYILKPINPDDLRASLARIIDHQRDKASLLDQDARLRAIFDSAVEGIITIDESGAIESFNRAAEEMFGYSGQDILGQNVKLLMPTPYKEDHDTYLSRFIHTGERRIIGTGREVFALRKDGSTFPILLSVSEVQLGDRRLFTGMIRDVTDLKQAEERLLQSERLAAIGQAMAGLAHESRNALQRSQAGLEMLSRRVQDRPEAVKLLKRIQRAQDDLHQLYEDVREYAAPIRLDIASCSLNDIVQHAWSDLELAREGRLATIRELGKDVHCQADAFSLRRVFRNIFDNALAASEDPVEISIEYADVTLEGRSAVRITISDNGPGLTAESSRQIFEEFFTTKTRGTGLGMAICKRIVLAHHGKIEAGPADPQGAQIIITIPRSET